MVSVEIAFALSDRTVFLCGPVSFAVDETSTFTLKGKELGKPYLGGTFNAGGTPYYYMVVSDPALTGKITLAGLTLHHAGQRPLEFPAFPVRDAPEPFFSFYERLDDGARAALFMMLAREAGGMFDLDAAPRFRAVLFGLIPRLRTNRLSLTLCGWLTPSLLYLEGEVQATWPVEAPEILAISCHHTWRAVAHCFQTGDTTFSALAAVGAVSDDIPQSLVFFSGGVPIVLEGSAVSALPALAFMQALAAKPDYRRQLIREEIARFVLPRAIAVAQEDTRALLHTLQHFVAVSPTPYTDPAMPFNLCVEYALPLGNEGFFVSGWMRDPYRMLEEMELVSALGFSVSMTGAIHRIPRSDVRDSLAETPYADFREDHGFVAYVPIPQEIRNTFEGLAELHACRFHARLKGGILIEVTPAARFLDPFAARDFILKCTPPDAVREFMLEQCIGPAAAAAQERCMREAGVREVWRYGREIKAPKVSLIIPLYKRLDFLRVQHAVFAADPDMRDVEIVYVLDSPEQEGEVRHLLHEFGALYRLGVTLVVMRRNAGYAAATNAGARQARGGLLVLLNSDVFPKSKGWLPCMAQFYESSPQIGTLAPKLLYEDDSIQHAGMYFSRAAFPFWINLHYCKGYPEAHARASVSRAVPAVTGACLMIGRDLYQEVGGLSTAYVIGDFEDSDLCLKVAQTGRQNWYYADAALYHLERQSVALNEAYEGTLAWRYNARLHDRQWGGLIEQLMQQEH